MGILKIIEWKDQSRDQIVYKFEYNIKKDFITKGSALTVRETQAAIFCDKGRMADVFLPGFYKLDTHNIPVLTKLMSWKYGFESPFKSDVYFVNTKQFTDQKWGTQNPITIRDREFGPVRIRGYGTYAYRIKDPYVFMTELSSTNSSFKTSDIVSWLKSIIVVQITTILGETMKTKSVVDIASHIAELSDDVKEKLKSKFVEYGLDITAFNFENFSLPPEVEKAVDESASLGILGKNMDTYEAKARADALKAAASNTGSVGGFMGMGIGVQAGQSLGGAFQGGQSNAAAKATAMKENEMSCPNCNAKILKTAKFCPECGGQTGLACGKCKATVPPGTKFCPECGAKIVSGVICPKCKEEAPLGTKFCPSCGEKI